MFRICKIKLAFVSILATTGMASAQQDLRNTFWVGTHLHGVTEYSTVLKLAVGERLTLLEKEIDMNDSLERHYRGHNVDIDSAVGTMTSELETKYGLTADKTLMVMSGYGVGNASDILSVVYVGPPSNKFSVEVARAKLLSTNDQPSAQTYTSLLFLYAMIKEADSKGLDFQTFVAPLLDKALSLTLQSQDADPQGVAKIRENLLALIPS